MGGIVLLSAYLPEVGVHGLLAGGEVLLGDEVQLVLGDLVQILPAGRYHRAHLGEALTERQLFGGRLGAAVVLAYHVDTRADGVGRRRYTVGSQESILVQECCALLPGLDNAPGNFVKVEQRLTIRIALDENSAEDLQKLQAGYSVECEVKY